MLHRVEEIVFPLSVLVLSIEIPKPKDCLKAFGAVTLEIDRQLFVRLGDFEQ